MKNKKLEEVSFALHKIAAEYIAGKTNKLSEGNYNIKQEIFVELTNECKKLKNALETNNIQKISEIIKRKNYLAEKFYNATCIKWLL